MNTVTISIEDHDRLRETNSIEVEHWREKNSELKTEIKMLKDQIKSPTLVTILSQTRIQNYGDFSGKLFCNDIHFDNINEATKEIEDKYKYVTEALLDAKKQISLFENITTTSALKLFIKTLFRRSK